MSTPTTGTQTDQPGSVVNTYAFYLNSERSSDNEGSSCVFKLPYPLTCSNTNSYFNMMLTSASVPNAVHYINSSNNTLSFRWQGFVTAIGAPPGTLNDSYLNTWQDLTALDGRFYATNANLTITLPVGNPPTLNDLITTVNTLLAPQITAVNAALNIPSFYNGTWQFNLTFAASTNTWINNTQAAYFGINNFTAIPNISVPYEFYWIGQHRLVCDNSEIMGLLGWNDSRTLIPSATFNIHDPQTATATATTVSPYHANIDPGFITYVCCENVLQTKSYVSSDQITEVQLIPSTVIGTIFRISELKYSPVEYSYPIKLQILDRSISTLKISLKDYRFRPIYGMTEPWSLTLLFEDYLPASKPSMNVQQLNDLEMQMIQQEQLQTEIQMEMLKKKKS